MRGTRRRRQIKVYMIAVCLSITWLIMMKCSKKSDAKLADRTATLEAARSAEVIRIQEEPRPSPNLKDRKTGREKAIPGSPNTGDAIAKVRQELSEAQRSRGVMETRLQSVTEELQKLKIQSSLDSKRIGELSKEKAGLTTGMRDRDEELRGKAKLLEV